MTAEKAKSSGRGSKPGERRGGRQKGTPNKSTAEIKALAQEYAPRALEALAKIMDESESDAARVSAARELLDRGYGKPKQPLIGGDEDDPAIQTVTRVVLVGGAAGGE